MTVLKFLRVDIEKLRPYPNSRPVCDKRVYQLLKHPQSLFVPITITSDNLVVDGNHRVEALRRIGYKEVNCYEV